LLLIVATVTTIACGHWLATIPLSATEVSYAGVITWTHWPSVASIETTTSHSVVAATHTSIVANSLVLVESSVRSLASIASCKTTIEAICLFVLFMPRSLLLLLLWSCRLEESLLSLFSGPCS